MYFINLVLYLNTMQIEIHVTFVIGCLCEDFFRYNFMKYFFLCFIFKKITECVYNAILYCSQIFGTRYFFIIMSFLMCRSVP